MANISSTTDSTLSLIDDYIAELAGKSTSSTARGSVVFAIDATASRQPTWDLASHLMGAMFREVAAIGSLDIKVVYFGGTSGISRSS